MLFECANHLPQEEGGVYFDEDTARVTMGWSLSLSLRRKVFTGGCTGTEASIAIGNMQQPCNVGLRE